jgi:hypothetical protein
MLSNTSYDLILRALGLTTTFLDGTYTQMATKPEDVPRGFMKAVMKPSRQNRQRHSPSELLPPDLQKMVNKEEQDRMVYEDAWTRTYGPLLPQS